MEDSFGRNYKSSLFNKNSKAKQARYFIHGMSTMDEIKKAVSVLRENGTGEITVLHCTTEYPAPFSDVNLKAMLTIKKSSA